MPRPAATEARPGDPFLAGETFQQHSLETFKGAHAS
jgi:hypothetical protein